MTPVSSRYNIPGVVPVCFYLFQAFGLKPAKVEKFENVGTCPGIFLITCHVHKPENHKNCIVSMWA